VSDYRSLTGHTYRSTETGRETRAEKGDKISDMNDVAAQYELEAGNIEPWTEEKKTTKKRGGGENEHTA
jgi:hypothetical protein